MQKDESKKEQTIIIFSRNFTGTQKREIFFSHSYDEESSSLMNKKKTRYIPVILPDKQPCHNT
jgi:hypothetical protein